MGKPLERLMTDRILFHICKKKAGGSKTIFSLPYKLLYIFLYQPVLTKLNNVSDGASKHKNAKIQLTGGSFVHYSSSYIMIIFCLHSFGK
jgi:hypothetical protein